MVAMPLPYGPILAQKSCHLAIPRRFLGISASCWISLTGLPWRLVIPRRFPEASISHQVSRTNLPVAPNHTPTLSSGTHERQALLGSAQSGRRYPDAFQENRYPANLPTPALDVVLFLSRKDRQSLDDMAADMKKIEEKLNKLDKLDEIACHLARLTGAGDKTVPKAGSSGDTDGGPAHDRSYGAPPDLRR